LPDATITVTGDTAICQGDSVMLSAAVGHPGYSWNTNATTQSIYVKFVGNYSVTVTSVNNCSAVSAPVAITVNSLPAVPSITRSGDTLTSSPAVSYQWYGNNGIISGATDQHLDITQAGTYYVEITDANGCKNRSADFNAVTVGLQLIEEATGIKLFPNPSTGSFIIEFADKQSHYVEITDAIGQIIMAETQIMHGVPTVMDAAVGIYFVRIKQAKAITSLKLNMVK
jgi:hypothetical protein